MPISQQNIVFIGLMGAGKTTIGRQVAQYYKWPFLDTDKVIEERTGVSIPLIFELEGEAGFRKRETDVVKELSARKNTVIATGGGAILNAVNRNYLQKNARIFYLKADIDHLFERTSRDKNRPLLQTDNPKQRLYELLKEREPIYLNMADWVVETNGRSIYKVVNEIVKIVDK